MSHGSSMGKVRLSDSASEHLSQINIELRSNLSLHLGNTDAALAVARHVISPCHHQYIKLIHLTSFTQFLSPSCNEAFNRLIKKTSGRLSTRKNQFQNGQMEELHNKANAL